jgi:hypothetical protein
VSIHGPSGRRNGETWQLAHCAIGLLGPRNIVVAALHIDDVDTCTSVQYSIAARPEGTALMELIRSLVGNPKSVLG